MNRSNLPMSVVKLKKWWDSPEKTLRCDLPFQRHAGVWSAFTKSSLIHSMLADSYILPIVLLKDRVGVDERGKDVFVYNIEDGQQRLTNVFSFMDEENGWALHSATPTIRYEGEDYELAGKKYIELPKVLQDAIAQFRFSIQCLEDYTMEEAETLFFNINSGVNLSPIQKAKSRMGTDLIKFFTDLLGGSFFTQAISITEAQAKREEDLLMLIQAALLLDNRHEGLDYKTISAAFCLSYAESIRGIYNADKRAMLTETIQFLNNSFETRNKFLKKNNVPIVVVIAKIALEQQIETKAFRSFINDFASSLYPAYEEASGSGNVKCKLTQMRLRVMFLAFCKYFKLNAEEVKKPFADGIPLYEGLSAEDDLGIPEPEDETNPADMETIPEASAPAEPVYTEPPNTEVLEESGIAEGQELEDGGVESGEVEEIGA